MEFELLVNSIEFLTSKQYISSLLEFSDNKEVLLELLRIQYKALLDDDRKEH